MYTVLLLKVGTPVYVTGDGWGMAGRITRVLPQVGGYHVDNARGPRLVKPAAEAIRAYTDRRI